MFLHKRIKRFELQGQINDDSIIPRMKNEYIRLLNDTMRDSGYAPRLDIDPDWSLAYNGNYYEFTLSVYGAYVGKRQAASLVGIDKNRGIYNGKKNENMQEMPTRETPV